MDSLELGYLFGITSKCEISSLPIFRLLNHLKKLNDWMMTELLSNVIESRKRVAATTIDAAARLKCNGSPERQANKDQADKNVAAM